tara:strand:- start:1531 stop:1821 length:291 start_codon:yes stop_codon:yes gene_type:complete
MNPERDMKLVDKVSKLEQDMIHTNLGMSMIVERVEKELLAMKQSFDHIRREEKLIRKRLTLLEEEVKAGRVETDSQNTVSSYLQTSPQYSQENRIE